MKKTMTRILIASLLASGVAMPAFAAPQRHDHRPQQTVRHAPPPHKMVTPARHHWQHGQRMTKVDRSRYVVSDWNRRGLRAPPRGYHWVRERSNAGDYILVGIATGLIASVIAR